MGDEPTSAQSRQDPTGADSDVRDALLESLATGSIDPQEVVGDDSHGGVAAATVALLHQDGHIEHYSHTADSVSKRQAQIDNIARLIAHTAFIMNDSPEAVASDVAESLREQTATGGISHWFGPPADYDNRRDRVSSSDETSPDDELDSSMQSTDDPPKGAEEKSDITTDDHGDPAAEDPFV